MYVHYINAKIKKVVGMVRPTANVANNPTSAGFDFSPMLKNMANPMETSTNKLKRTINIFAVAFFI